MVKWQPGDRVTRQVFMDNGMWSHVGDSCLKDSPLKHGVVNNRTGRRSWDDEVCVLWDDGTTGLYLDHGLDKE